MTPEISFANFLRLLVAGFVFGFAFAFAHWLCGKIFK